MSLTPNPQNFLTKLDVPSFGTLRNTFPVIQGNTVTLQMEIPFAPNEVELVVSDTTTGRVIRKCGIVEYKDELCDGRHTISFLVDTNDTCTPGDFQYSFICSTSDRQQVFTKQVQLKVIGMIGDKSVKLLRTVRTLLGDDAIPTRAQVWTDLELLELAELTLNEVNITPTFTCFTLQGAPPAWGFLLAIGTEYHALRALYNTESRDVFNFSDDGLSVDINIRSEKYMAMINHLSGTYTKIKDDVKRHFRPRGTAYTSQFSNLGIRSLRPYLIASLSSSNY